MPILDVSRDWKTLLSYLPADYAHLAKVHDQIPTQYPDLKVASADDLLRFIFVHVGADLPLRQTVAIVKASGGPTLSPNRLHKKMRKAAPYLRALVEKMTVGILDDVSPERWAGYDMVAVDASAFSGKGATGTDARAHVALRLADLSIESVSVTDGTGAESFKRFRFRRGQLVLADRGYSSLAGILSVLLQEADVLVRVNRGALLFMDEKDTIMDLLELARTLAVDEALDKDVRATGWVNGHRKTVGGRLLLHKLLPEEAEKGRDWVRREQGKHATAESFEMAGYVVLFTTAKRSRLSAERCLAAYRLRWQIELLFKRWKSLCGFDRLPNERPDTIESWIYAKVLLALLMDRLGAPATGLSPPVQLVGPQRVDRRRRAERIQRDAFASVASLRSPTGEATVENFIHSLATHCRRDSSPSSHGRHQ